MNWLNGLENIDFSGVGDDGTSTDSSDTITHEYVSKTIEGAGKINDTFGIEIINKAYDLSRTTLPDAAEGPQRGGLAVSTRPIKVSDLYNDLSSGAKSLYDSILGKSKYDSFVPDKTSQSSYTVSDSDFKRWTGSAPSQWKKSVSDFLSNSVSKTELTDFGVSTGGSSICGPGGCPGAPSAALINQPPPGTNKPFDVSRDILNPIIGTVTTVMAFKAQQPPKQAIQRGGVAKPRGQIGSGGIPTWAIAAGGILGVGILIALISKD